VRALAAFVVFLAVLVVKKKKTPLGSNDGNSVGARDLQGNRDRAWRLRRLATRTEPEII
jgi:hypothetical protein